MFRPEGTACVMEEERGTERGCFVGSLRGQLMAVVCDTDVVGEVASVTFLLGY